MIPSFGSLDIHSASTLSTSHFLLRVTPKSLRKMLRGPLLSTLIDIFIEKTFISAPIPVTPFASAVPLLRSTQIAETNYISQRRNSCIAQTIKRFPIDLYHMNDFHGAAAPLHLLPRVIPCCLWLHDADIQGLWSAQTLQETEELCRIFNLTPDIVRRYLKFGEGFNLLHAGVSYIRLWQSGFGAVGVSTKYSTRSFARYPIFWGLDKIGSLTYPDPVNAQNQRLNVSVPPTPNRTMVGDFKAKQALLRIQTQEWAQLEKNPNADLFVFVGRWSKQKGIDLIADLFPAILEKHSTAQLVCIGPIVDLYGKFAALKLENISRLYPRRVCSRPELTVAPSCIYGGAEFVLIPSRDEPYSLTGLEFGRKGALGVGARVGGSGNLPGWWFTVESTSSKHMISQFKKAVEAALASNAGTRADMRAQSLKQQFPVSQWRSDLDVLHDNAIRLSQRKSGSKACGMASLNRSGMRLAEGIRPKLSQCLKGRGGRPTGLEKTISPIKPLDRVANLTWPRAADTSNLTPGLRLEPGHLSRNVGRSRDSFGENDQLGKFGTSFRYVLGHTSPFQFHQCYHI